MPLANDDELEGVSQDTDIAMDPQALQLPFLVPQQQEDNNDNANEHDNDNNDVDVSLSITSITTTTSAASLIAVIPNMLYAYLQSTDCRESLVCFLCLFVVYLIKGVTTWHVYQRPIPFQYLDQSAEYAKNGVYDEISIVPNAVPNAWLLVYSFLFPLVLQSACALVHDVMLYSSSCHCEHGDGYGRQRGTVVAPHLHATWCVYGLAFALTAAATHAIKRYDGYLRPVFYEYCKPSEDYTTCTNSAEQQRYVATGLRSSFPSGHASNAFCGLTLLALYWYTQWGSAAAAAATTHWNSRNRQNNNNIKTRRIVRYAALLAAPLSWALALYIATSRVHDNMHHPADVVGGAVLGTSMAAFVHSLWFP